ncbi:hypothetical protein CVU76_00855 [Candidatus Dojkabacteria bacterium HGW-Dojkabacteria-1]|uniref:50S ribosomal protein L17 n=1 Tax=Candidatus Dojkabacteria bacterium HGW-Dojkabacteria-1 TaxID=2013761 RepID=A0A2N2F2Y1_9BACT|nr:MAG: hypothetical protein CVU76_00855 [Candidatus Dojkabacteria bacterium HGW-Dojkabacteria-1]
MYKRIGTKKLGRTMAHRKALVYNQLRSLVKSGSIKTTTSKAKVVKAEMESLISKSRNSKEGDLNLRRKLQVVFGSTELVKKFLEVSSKSTSKVILKKVGFRDGDNAEVSMLELKGLKVKSAKKVEKVEKEETKVEKKEPVVEKERKGILNLGAKKSITKGIAPINKERAKSRSGL